MVLLAYSLGAAEVVDLRCEQVDFKMAVRRRQRESSTFSFAFVSERGAPLLAAGSSRLVERAAIENNKASR
jgi:hypothetical protein